jgi:hypothetical protein
MPEPEEGPTRVFEGGAQIIIGIKAVSVFSFKKEI